ncbi:MAG: leucine-rich repeat domain-containing protein [Simkania negevensis]|nr:leucine-rich repeat domain-containing protein [Simkania negevensis]
MSTKPLSSLAPKTLLSVRGHPKGVTFDNVPESVKGAIFHMSSESTTAVPLVSKSWQQSCPNSFVPEIAQCKQDFRLKAIFEAVRSNLELKEGSSLTAKQCQSIARGVRKNILDEARHMNIKVENPQTVSLNAVLDLIEEAENKNLVSFFQELIKDPALSAKREELLEMLDPHLDLAAQASKIRSWMERESGLSGVLRNVTTLDLSNLGLTTLPMEVCKLVSLQRLNLAGNCLTSLPKEIGDLVALTSLWLKDNRLTSLPREIRNLTALRFLTLHNNRLTSLLQEIGNLTALTQLSLNGNRLTSLPQEIGDLTALTHLWLHNNQLTSLLQEIGNLTALRLLALEDNQLTSLPKSFTYLNALDLLYLEKDRVTVLPPLASSEARKRLLTRLRIRWLEKDRSIWSFIIKKIETVKALIRPLLCLEAFFSD